MPIPLLAAGDSSLMGVIVLVVALGFAFLCANLAKKKGHSALGFGILGFFLPLIGLIIVLVISPRRGG